jgi:hypothetical protein
MSGDERELLLRHPPRMLTPGEHGLVAEWLSLTGDVAMAYVSERRSDDPAMYRRIVIAAGPSDHPTHLIHCPNGRQLWVKMTLGPQPSVAMFDTLRMALNSIRSVLVDG